MEEESLVIKSLERRAGFLRSEIRRVDAMIEELRKVDTLLAYYKGREKFGSHTLSFLMPEQPEIRVSDRVSDNDRRNREIMAAVRRILLTEPAFEARVNIIFDRLPEEVRTLIGGRMHASHPKYCATVFEMSATHSASHIIAAWSLWYANTIAPSKSLH